MKKLISIFILAGAITLIASCDYVKNPYPEVNANLDDTTTCPAPVFPVLSTHTKKILIEDYTAHTCPNCPRAARKLIELDTVYPGRIIGIGLHVGGLANPAPSHVSDPTAYTADFRTKVGKEYDDLFKVSAAGLPGGLINRKDFDTTSTSGYPHIKSDLTWSSYVASIISEPAKMDLQIINSYDASTRKLCCAIKSSYITAITGNYNLVALIVQDGIIDWQDDDLAHISNYEFRDMLRDAITPSGAWGELLITGNATAATSNTKRFAYKIPVQYTNIPCDADKCYIIAFVYNTSTYEIIQSEKAKVIP